MSRGLLAVLIAIGALTRGMLAHSGGIWADEGMLLNIVEIPTWFGMLEFLRQHESHPPLFYILVRGWRGITAGSDAALLAFVVVLGTAIVPLTYAVGRSLFSERSAVLAAALVALSPSLTEHSAQVRPYGLLPILVLLSCYWLLRALQRGGWIRWTGWVVATALLLYTHNWMWLIFGAQWVTAGAVLLTVQQPARETRIREFVVGVLAIGLCYAPWLPAFVFQITHTGHTALPLDGIGDTVGFFIFAISSAPFMVLFGTYPKYRLGLVTVAALLAFSVVVVMRLFPSLAARLPAFFLRRPAVLPSGVQSRQALSMLLLVPTVSIVAAIAMSPRSNLTIERCIAMLAPLVILAGAYTFDRLAGAAVRSANLRPLFAGALILSLSISAINVGMLLPTQRSNAREVAQSVRINVRPDDLMILAPEWYAASFNRYFPASIEQIDYPHTGRTGPLSFAGTRSRRLDTTATARLRETIATARADGRRVWFITGRNYLQYLDEQLPKLMSEGRQFRHTSLFRVKEARDMLLDQFGPPDSSHFVRGAVLRYEDIVPMLFSSHIPARAPF